MYNLFTTKVSYVKTCENGLQKKVTEPYLVDALSYAEAEARIIEQVQPYIQGEFNVADIKRAHYSEVFVKKSDETFYKIKIDFITLDEKTGGEKKTQSKMLVTANNISEALSNFQEAMKDTMSDYVITGIEETSIVDLFPFVENFEKCGSE